MFVLGLYVSVSVLSKKIGEGLGSATIKLSHHSSHRTTRFMLHLGPNRGISERRSKQSAAYILVELSASR